MASRPAPMPLSSPASRVSSGVSTTLWTPRGLFDAIVGPFIAFFVQHGRFAIVMLLAICLYRMPDFVMGPMANPFYADLGIEIAGIEFIETADGRQVVYDINTNTNYNPSVESAEQSSGRQSAANRIAEYVSDTLAEAAREWVDEDAVLTAPDLNAALMKALDLVADRLASLRAAYGADAVAASLGPDPRIVDLIVTRMRAAISPYRRVPVPRHV